MAEIIALRRHLQENMQKNDARIKRMEKEMHDLEDELKRTKTCFFQTQAELCNFYEKFKELEEKWVQPQFPTTDNVEEVFEQSQEVFKEMRTLLQKVEAQKLDQESRIKYIENVLKDLLFELDVKIHRVFETVNRTEFDEEEKPRQITRLYYLEDAKYVCQDLSVQLDGILALLEKKEKEGSKAES